MCVLAMVLRRDYQAADLAGYPHPPIVMPPVKIMLEANLP
jgi:hypothetical protein